MRWLPARYSVATDIHSIQIIPILRSGLGVPPRANGFYAFAVQYVSAQGVTLFRVGETWPIADPTRFFAQAEAVILRSINLPSRYLVANLLPSI